MVRSHVFQLSRPNYFVISLHLLACIDQSDLNVTWILCDIGVPHTADFLFCITCDISGVSSKDARSVIAAQLSPEGFLEDLPVFKDAPSSI